MKKLIISLTFMATTILIYSCAKNLSNKPDYQVVVTEEAAVQKLIASETFLDFSTHFIPDFINLMEYHRSEKIRNQKNTFLQQIRNSNNEEVNLSNIYNAYSLSYEHAIVLKNKIDNDLLKLFNTNTYLLNFDEIITQRIILNALNTGLKSDDPKWKESKKELNQIIHFKTHKNFITYSTTGNKLAPDLALDLTVDEVWECLQGALGLGSASILSVAGLQKLAKQGIQEIVLTASKFLAKNIGWIGAAITLLDFGSCIYSETID